MEISNEIIQAVQEQEEQENYGISYSAKRALVKEILQEAKKLTDAGYGKIRVGLRRDC